MLAILGGIACATLASLVMKRHGHGVHAVVHNGLGAVAGSGLLVPLAFALGDGLALPPSPPGGAASRTGPTPPAVPGKRRRERL